MSQSDKVPKAIIFMGIQASGKSTFFSRILPGILYISIWIPCIPELRRQNCWRNV